MLNHVRNLIEAYNRPGVGCSAHVNADLKVKLTFKSKKNLSAGLTKREHFSFTRSHASIASEIPAIL